MGWVVVMVVVVVTSNNNNNNNIRADNVFCVVVVLVVVIAQSHSHDNCCHNQLTTNNSNLRRRRRRRRHPLLIEQTHALSLWQRGPLFTWRIHYSHDAFTNHRTHSLFTWHIHYSRCRVVSPVISGAVWRPDGPSPRRGGWHDDDSHQLIRCCECSACWHNLSVLIG